MADAICRAIFWMRVGTDVGLAVRPIHDNTSNLATDHCRNNKRRGDKKKEKKNIQKNIIIIIIIYEVIVENHVGYCRVGCLYAFSYHYIVLRPVILGYYFYCVYVEHSSHTRCMCACVCVVVDALVHIRFYGFQPYYVRKKIDSPSPKGSRGASQSPDSDKSCRTRRVRSCLWVASLLCSPSDQTRETSRDLTSSPTKND